MTLLALRVAAQYTQDVLLATAAQSAVWRVRGAVTDRLLALDLPFFEVQCWGDVSASFRTPVR